MSFDCVDGDIGQILGYVARRINYEAATLRQDQVSGHRTDLTITADYQSNLLSGTAVDLLGSIAPPGTSNNLERAVILVIRDILASCQGVIAWGGDMAYPTEGFFQVDVPPGDPALSALAASLRGASVTDAPGAIDTSAPQRRQRAQKFQAQTPTDRPH